MDKYYESPLCLEVRFGPGQIVCTSAGPGLIVCTSAGAEINDLTTDESLNGLFF